MRLEDRGAVVVAGAAGHGRLGRRVRLGVGIGLGMWLLGCSAASRSPDAIRNDAAVATAAGVRGAKSIVMGVFDGLRTKGPMNLNRAPVEDLETLPGVDRATARRIVAGRPYRNSVELRERKIVSKEVYNRIATKVAAR